MNWKVLEKVVAHLKKTGYVDGENILYFPEDYKFTATQYRNLFEELGRKSTSFKYSQTKPGNFPESLAYFKLRNFKFIWRLLIGQGSAYQLREPDKNLKFDDEKCVVLAKRKKKVEKKTKKKIKKKAKVLFP